MFENSTAQQPVSTPPTPSTSQPAANESPIMGNYQMPGDLPAVPHIKKRSRWPLVIIVVIALLGLVGGGVWAYSYYFPSPQKVLAQAIANMNSVESESIDGSIIISYESNRPQEENPFIPIPKSLTVDFNGETNSKDINNPEFNMSLGLSSDEIPFGRIEGDMMLADKSLYFRLRRFPDIPFFDISSLRNQWIRFDLKDLPDSEQIFNRNLNESQQERLRALGAQYPIVEFSQDLGNEDFNGQEHFHYQLAINKENLRKVIFESMTIAGETMADYQQMTDEQKNEINKVFDSISFTNMEIWINRKTMFPSRLKADLTMTDEMGTTKVSVSASTARHNQDIDIVGPESSMTLEEMQMLLEQQFTPATSSVSGLPGDQSPSAESLPGPTDDSDQDGLPDIMEDLYGTDPFNADSDGDGYGDNEEIENGYNPLGPGKSTDF